MTGTPITPARLARIRELFDGALELTADDRDRYLARACVDDEPLRREVESLLAVLDRDSDTWNRPLQLDLKDVVGDGRDEAVVGTRIGAYEVTRLIGYGGMGAVYEGVRADDQYQKRVALKFLRRGLEGDLAIRRFRYERQILAHLNHTNIAALLDGGVTPDGQPYIVMEFVAGVPITTYAKEQRLDVRGRVHLLRQVCAAVQHAHQNLVVHRDLKPGNILVTTDGVVKLLDFGIARLLREAEGPEQLPPTQGGLHAFTPDYASPEQVRGGPVATPSDLYSLGVIACELLSGHRPFNFDGKLFAEMQAMICEAPAPRPSTLVTDADADNLGGASPSRVRRQLAGDLDAIVLQALRKEPERRYNSAEQLGEDLRRYLEGLPVAARRDTVRYRVGKFVRRHQAEVAASVLLVASLVGGIVATTRQARRAEVERAKVQQVNAFLSTMLAAVDPGNSGRDVTVAQVLSQAAKDVAKQPLSPEIEAQLRHTIAQTYYGLGQYDSATSHATRAYELRRRVFGERHPETVTSLSYVGAMAEARGAFVEAESLARVALTLRKTMPDRNTGEIATALDNLGRAVEAQGRLDEAMQIKVEALGLLRRLPDDSASRARLAFSVGNLAVSHMYRGEFAKAESLAREAVELVATIHGTSSFNYGGALRNLAAVLDEQRKVEAADSAIRASMDVLRKTAGPTHNEYLRSVAQYAQLRYAANDMKATVAAAREVVAQIGKGLEESEPLAASTLQALGLALDSLGQHAAADTALRQSLDIRRKYLPPNHWAIASSEAILGYHLSVMGRTADAERMLTESYGKLVVARGADAQVTKRVALRLADLMERAGRRSEAAQWRQKGAE